MSVSIKKEGGMQNRTVCNWLKTHRERDRQGKKGRGRENTLDHLIKENGLF